MLQTSKGPLPGYRSGAPRLRREHCRKAALHLTPIYVATGRFGRRIASSRSGR